MAIYLFYGEETYLLETRVKKIKKEYQQLILGINFIQIDDTNAEELIADLETPAFGFDKKLIIAKNTGLFKKEKKTTKTDSKKKKVDDTKLPLNEKIAKYIQENSEELKDIVDLVFVEQEVDKNALYQAIEKVGEVKEFALLKLPDLIANIKKIAVAYKVNIDDATAKYLVECCGTSMQDLINELRKLIEYKGENSNITKQDIDLLCTKQIQAVIFDLTDNLGKKETSKALEVYNGLISNKEPIQKILITLYNHFKKLYIIKIAEKYNEDVATAMNLKPNQLFLVSKYKTQARYFETQELREVLEALIDLDANYKIGLISLEIGLEAILCRYCSK
ncbi:dNA polymerase III delta subunit [Clostridium sp. CAG:508]|jgi:DNA polymerase-3 subunit delta|nr:dNA polymerase III delta subunit [Clostridium sp. CAG:508]